MSFMNPVDMVEEDAADLQFPKEPPEKPRKRYRQILIARSTAETRHLYLPCPAKHIKRLNCRNDIEDDPQKYEARQHSPCECCAICQHKLHEPYIKCVDCVSSLVLLCLKCFSRGREMAQHLNNHSYIIMRDDIQIFPSVKTLDTWTAHDERLLLRTLRHQGYGNWEAVAKATKYRHTPEECRDHYHEHYFGGIFERLIGLRHQAQTYFPECLPYITKMNLSDPPRHDDFNSIHFKLMAGYRCARGDFDTPYDNSSESILTTILDHNGPLSDADDSDVAAGAENVPWSKEDKGIWRLCDEELKCALVLAYNHRLRERRRRYRIMRDHGLIMASRTLGWISKCTEALESETNCQRFLSFMQLSEPMKFDMLVESLYTYKDILKSIYRLYECRQNGIRTLTGAVQYFKLKKKRLKEHQERLKSESYHKLLEWRKLIKGPQAWIGGGAAADATLLGYNVVNAPRRKPSPMDIIGLPGYAKLNDGERQLCSVERIYPEAYLEYKRLFIQENMKLGQLRLQDARRLIKIDVNKTRQIYDLLADQGHINKPATAAATT